MPSKSYGQSCPEPITKGAILKVLKKGVHKDDLEVLIGELRNCGTAFWVTDADEQEFRAVGARLGKKGLADLLRAISHNYRVPDIALRFIYSKSPALVIVNLSDVVVRDIKWVVVLWNTDLPERNDPLQIPVAIFDWIKGREAGGPQNLFGNPNVAPLLKPGNRLIGSASVSCPECPRGRSYIVHIVWGEGGWFSEIEDERAGSILVPRDFSRPTREKYFKEIEALRLPRIPIIDPK